MSHNEPPGPVDVQAALDRLPDLGPDAAAVVDEWARQPEVVPTAPISFERAVRVHVASR
jgi:hypothetical protein